MSNLVSSVRYLIKYWWVSLIVGLLAIGLSIWTLMNPLETLVIALWVFICAFFICGVLQIMVSIYSRKFIDRWGWYLTSGIVDLIFGILLVTSPVLSFGIMLFYVGFWVMFQSIWSISASIEMQKMGVSDWGWLLTISILGVIMSIVLISNPLFASGFIVYLLSITLFCYGFFRCYYAIRLRKIGTNIDQLKQSILKFETKLKEMHDKRNNAI